MVIEELHQKEEGVLIQRNMVVKANGCEVEEIYYLVKGQCNKYFIGLSEDGTAGNCFVSEEMMLNMINDEELSRLAAFDIYVQRPQLSYWMD